MTITQAQRDMIECKVRALAAQRDRDIYDRTFGFKKYGKREHGINRPFRTRKQILDDHEKGLL